MSDWHKLCSICPYGELKYNLQKKETKKLQARVKELEEEITAWRVRADIDKEEIARVSIGKWVWAELYGPDDESCEDYPENPNEHCFTKVWLPDE